MNNPAAFRGAALFAVSIMTFVAAALSASSHGFAGDRFFPATLTTDDPFAASEMSLPTISEFRQRGEPPFNEFDISTDISLLLFQNIALTAGGGCNVQRAANQRTRTGFDNVELNLNSESGHNVGVIAQVHFYLDDLLPKIFGKPLFGR